MIAQFFFQRRRWAGAAFQGDKCDDALALSFHPAVLPRPLPPLSVTDQCAFDFRGAETMPGDIEDVVDPANDPKIAIADPGARRRR